MATANSLEALGGKFFESAHILKMFPISFERTNKYDRVLSEENLVDWFRSVASDSADTTKNSRYSYVLTDTIDESTFGNSTRVNYFEFVIGGYYVKMTDEGVKDFGFGDIYAVIDEVTTTDFRQLAHGDSITDENFSAIRFISVTSGTELNLEKYKSMYKLHILTKTSSGYTIPAESKRSTYAVDGGEID